VEGVISEVTICVFIHTQNIMNGEKVVYKRRGEKKLSISNISTIINVDGDDLVLLIMPKKVYKNSKKIIFTCLIFSF